MSNGTVTGVQLPLFSFDSTVVPDIDFCVKDASQIEADVITNYEKYFYLITSINKTLGRGDPVRLFLLSIIYQLTVQRSIIDSTGKENLLKYSHGADLDNLGAKWGPRGLRTGATYAMCTIRFTLANALTNDVVVPVGTLVQTGDKRQFSTTADGTIPAGQLTVDLNAAAVATGDAYNGLVAGQINRLVSWNSPFLVAASNTTTSSGGADIESDDHFRARIWMAPESLSTAGPKEGYEYWAASASGDIMDVSVWSAPEVAGKVYIYPLMNGGRLPTQAECDQVYASCNADKVRPLTDQVFVQAPTAQSYAPNVNYWINSANQQFVTDLQAKINQAYQDYLTWQKTKIGRDINPSKCDQMMVDAGAKRTDIPGSTTFVYAILDEKTVAEEVAGSICSYAGLEDE